MADVKTKKNKASVSAFIAAIEDDRKRKDCRALAKMMREITGARGAMWGENIVGYGSYRYKYASGREGASFLAGFSPRKQALTLYIMSGFSGAGPLLKKLGKYKTGKACLYFKALADVDEPTLRKLIERSVAQRRED